MGGKSGDHQTKQEEERGCNAELSTPPLEVQDPDLLRNPHPSAQTPQQEETEEEEVVVVVWVEGVGFRPRR